MLYVSTAHYRYSGPDRLDITVKGRSEDGKIFAPTWKMVMDVHHNGVVAHHYHFLVTFRIVP